MNRHIEQVLEWHKQMKVPIGAYSEIPKNDRINLKMKLIEEECFELNMALKKSMFDKASPKSEIMSNVLKEACDVIYTVYSTLAEFGLHACFEAAWEEVHRSNMTKMPGIEDTYGKILKGPNFSPANIEKVFL